MSISDEIRRAALGAAPVASSSLTRWVSSGAAAVIHRKFLVGEPEVRGIDGFLRRLNDNDTRRTFLLLVAEALED
jgi:hypothetical protein